MPDAQAVPSARLEERAVHGVDMQPKQAAQLDPHAMLLQRVALIERSLLKANHPDEKAEMLPQLKMLRARINQMSGQYDKRFDEVRQRNARALDTLSGLSEKLAQSHEGYGRVGARSAGQCPPPAPSSGRACTWDDVADRRESVSSTCCSTAESSRCSSRDATPASRCPILDMTPPRRSQAYPTGYPGYSRAGSDLSMNPSSRVSSVSANTPPQANTPPTPSEEEVKDTPSPPWPLWPEFQERVGSQIGSLLQLRPQPMLESEWCSSKCSIEEDHLLYQATTMHGSPTSDPYGSYDLPSDWGLC